MTGQAAKKAMKRGMCIVIGCGNASAPGSLYCAHDVCFENRWTLTPEQLAEQEEEEDGHTRPGT